jgi:hypothetical protein
MSVLVSLLYIFQKLKIPTITLSPEMIPTIPESVPFCQFTFPQNMYSFPFPKPQNKFPDALLDPTVRGAVKKADLNNSVTHN